MANNRIILTFERIWRQGTSPSFKVYFNLSRKKTNELKNFKFHTVITIFFF